MIKIALISPFPPAVGGMAVLAETLKKSLQDQDLKIIPINTHPDVNSFFKKEKKIYKIHQLIVFLFELRKVAGCRCAIIISSSGDYFYSKGLTSLHICRIFGCKIILDFVGGGLLQFSEGDRLKLLKKLEKFDQIIVPSSPFKVSFEKAGVKCILFPHIVDIEKYSPDKGVITTPVFLSAKNLEEYSNVGSIIRAFALIKTHYPMAKLLITGRGPQKDYLKNLTLELNVKDVEFLEGLANEDMPGVYKRATVFLHATRIESFGIAIVEALASGTPVISTNVGGIPDIIKDGHNGYLIDYNDHQAMADRAIYLLKNKMVYDSFVREGIKTAQLYSPAYLGPMLKEIILSTISKT